jgi:hypothetical protein
MLLLRLDGWLALSRLALGASFMVARVGGREDVVDGAAEWEPIPAVPLRTVVERRLASSREPTDSIVGIRLITAPRTAIGS